MYNHQLDTFIVVADSGSINKAAEALFISPPAVIKQINLLEDSLGVRLFTRTHRGLQLTKAGQSVYEDARYIIAYCRESVERAKKADDTQPSVLRIGTSTMTPGQTIVDMWTQIREEIPDIKFQLVPFENTPENAREILKNMGKNIDIVCGVYDERALKNWQCAAQFVADVPMRCAVSVYDTLAKKDRLTVEDLHGIFSHPVLSEIGAKYGKTAAQIALKWNTQRGVSILPKSVHVERMEQNIDIWDFTLSDEDMQKIAELDLGHSEIVDHDSPEFVKALNGMKV